LLFVIPLISTKHDLRSFQNLYVNLRGGKGDTFIDGPGRHLVSLRHAQGRSQS